MRIEDSVLERLIETRKHQPDRSLASLSEEFGLATWTISKYTSFIAKGQDLTVDEVRTASYERYRRHLKNKCRTCNTGLSRGSKGYCSNCYIPKNTNTGFKRGVTRLETCEYSPTLNHHWMLDVKDCGVCKYCHKKKQYNGWKSVNSNSFHLLRNETNEERILDIDE